MSILYDIVELVIFGEVDNNMDIENRIQQYNTTLTAMDRKIAEYLLANKDSIIHKTILDLSKEMDVSAASITRFCKKIHFSSFQEMKYSLSKNADEPNKIEGTVDTIYHYYDMILKSTQQFISEEKVNGIVEKIMKAEKILFCGIGNSGLLALEFNSRIERMGMDSSAITDPHVMLMRSTLLDENDLLFCFSNSGKTQCVVDAAKLADENGATTIAVTNYEDTLLTEVVDEIVLISSYKFIQDEKFINTQIPGFFFLDILTYKLLKHGKLMDNRKKTLDAISEYGG
jgi:DNA-binding MurR/RpiR family transcriptional regulator